MHAHAHTCAKICAPVPAYLAPVNASLNALVSLASARNTRSCSKDAGDDEEEEKETFFSSSLPAAAAAAASSSSFRRWRLCATLRAMKGNSA